MNEALSLGAPCTYAMLLAFPTVGLNTGETLSTKPGVFATVAPGAMVPYVAEAWVIVTPGVLVDSRAVTFDSFPLISGFSEPFNNGIVNVTVSPGSMLPLPPVAEYPTVPSCRLARTVAPETLLNATSGVLNCTPGCPEANTCGRVTA